MNIVAYCRVSTKKDDQLNSLETQKKFFEEYAKRNGHNLVKIYADEGISGTKIRNRKEFLNMMEASKSGFFEMVVVKDISRLARNTVDFLVGIRDLKSRGIICNFVNANLTTEDGEMVLGVLALVAQEESGNTSKRVKITKKMTAEKGRVPNIVYGYDKTKGDYYNLSINQEEAGVIRRIYSMYLEEGHGASKIALILNKEGFRTKRNCNWSQNAICRILTNPLYTGRVINCKEEVTNFLTGIRVKKDESEWIVKDRPELRIIDDDTFNQANALLEGRNAAFNTNKTRQSNKHLFSTLIKCSECGYSYRRRVRTYKNTFTDWLCSLRYSKTTGEGKCKNTTVIDEAELIEVIEEYFAGILKDKPGFISSINAKFKRIYKTDDDNYSKETELTKSLGKLNRSREKCIQMYEDDVITRDEMKKKMSELNSQIEELNRELAYIQYAMNKGQTIDAAISDVFFSIEKVTSLETMTNAQLKRIIDKIVVTPDGKVDIHLKLLTDMGL